AFSTALLLLLALYPGLTFFHCRFLFSTARPPPRSTLFPYTTLFRSQRGVLAHFARSRGDTFPSRIITASSRAPSASRSASSMVRSEEHTSELQSRENLVCRLLLEKKKKTKKTTRGHSTECVSRIYAQ